VGRLHLDVSAPFLHTGKVKKKLKDLYKVLIYARVSTEDQLEKGYSIDSQIEKCTKKAEELSYKENEIFVIQDHVSGKNLNREGITKLREIIKSDNKPEMVIIYDPDRLARNLTHQLIVTDEILKNGIRLEFVNFEWKNTPEGMMYYQLRGIFAQYEREKIRERTIRGRMTKLEKHKKLSYDPRLFGYQFDTTEDVLIVDPKESKVVKLIFQWASEGHSGEEIARKLAEDGIPAPRGSKWYGATVTRILHNKSYLGTYMAYKVDYHQGYKRKRPIEEQYKIPIEPLIDTDTYNKAQKMLEKNRTSVGRPTDREYLLSGLGRCHCGKSIVASVKSGNREYTYYSCVGKHKKSYDADTGKASRLCKSDYWNSTVVDQLVWDRVKAVIYNPGEIVEEYYKIQLESHDLFSQIDNELDVLKDKETLEQQKKSRLLDLYVSGGIERKVYDEKIKEIEDSLTSVHRRIKELEEEQEMKYISETEIKEQVSYLREYQNQLEHLSYETKKKLMNILIRTVYFNKERELTLIFNIGQSCP
jgi:site-specific DNA recombinase